MEIEIKKKSFDRRTKHQNSYEASTNQNRDLDVVKFSNLNLK